MNDTKPAAMPEISVSRYANPQAVGPDVAGVQLCGKRLAVCGLRGKNPGMPTHPKTKNAYVLRHKPLTKMQAEVLALLEEHVAEHGYTPSIRALSALAGKRDVTSVITCLADRGRVLLASGVTLVCSCPKRQPYGSNDHEEPCSFTERAKREARDRVAARQGRVAS